MWQFLLRGKLRPDVEIHKPGIPEENESFKLKLPIFIPLCLAPVMPVFLVLQLIYVLMWL